MLPTRKRPNARKPKLAKITKKEETLAPKLEKISSWVSSNSKNADPDVREVRKLINKTLSGSFKVFHETPEYLADIDSVLKNAVSIRLLLDCDDRRMIHRSPPHNAIALSAV